MRARLRRLSKSEIVYLIGVGGLGGFYYSLKGLAPNSFAFVAAVVIYLLILRVIGIWLDRRGERVRRER